MPSKKETDRVLKILEKREGTLSLQPNATKLDKFRWELHQLFVRYHLSQKISQKQMAVLLGIDESKVSKILHHRLDEFSTDRLINLYEKLNPKMKLKVS